LSEFPTSVAIGDDGAIYASDMERGLFRWEGEARWTALEGPSDVVEIESRGAGVSVATGTRGVWRYEPAGWSAAGTGAVADLSRSHALLHDGSLYALAAGMGDAPPARAGG